MSDNKQPTPEQKVAPEDTAKITAPATTPKETKPKTKKATTTRSAKKTPAKKATVSKTEPVKVETPVSENPEDAFTLMDRANEEQILTEINGRGNEVANELVYSFTTKDGKQVTGLSWVGTKMAAYYMRQKKLVNLSDISVDYQKDPDDEEYYLFTATVEDVISKARSMGFKRQWKKVALKGGKVMDNNFWFEVGTSKAKRNAMQNLMPADWIAKQIQQWLKEGKVKVIGGAKTNNELPETSLSKVAPVINKINTAPDEETLVKAKDYVIGAKNLNGQEKNYLLKVIEARKQQVKKG